MMSATSFAKSKGNVNAKHIDIAGETGLLANFKKELMNFQPAARPAQKQAGHPLRRRQYVDVELCQHFFLAFGEVGS